MLLYSMIKALPKKNLTISSIRNLSTHRLQFSDRVGASLLYRNTNYTRTQFQRSYSQQQEGNQGSGKKSNGFKITLLLGLLALGSSVAAASYTAKPPVPALEPRKEPVFKPGDISVIFVLGGPGSGKGTQCAKLVDEYNFIHLSAGDLLRAEQKRPNSEYGELIARYIREGLIVPQEVTLKLLENAIKENFDKGNKRFLIDGFPRKMDQALSFEDQISKHAFTLFFECPESVMIERILQRGKTSGRTDDNVESLKKRFKTFRDTSMPVVNYFDKQDKVVKLSCNKPIDDVYASVKAALDNKLNIK